MQKCSGSIQHEHAFNASEPVTPSIMLMVQPDVLSALVSELRLLNMSFKSHSELISCRLPHLQSFFVWFYFVVRHTDSLYSLVCSGTLHGVLPASGWGEGRVPPLSVFFLCVFCFSFRVFFFLQNTT